MAYHTQYLLSKCQELMIELALQKLTDRSRQQYEDKIASLESRIKLLQEELETAYSFASVWADKYTRLLTTGKPDNFEAYSTDGFSTGTCHKPKP